ncbi:MAG: SDR family NAD(P)-dependent oxidoreductase, partial [Flavobacterium sp.]
MKTALITGATSGIGRATARYFAKNHFRLIICGRREDRLAELQDEFSSLTDVHTLNFDVSDKKAVNDAIASLPEAFSKIDILVNNAGNAHGLDPIENGNLDDWDAMIDINVKGLLYVSKAIIPK